MKFNNRGDTKTGLLVILVFLIIAGILVYKFGRPYYLNMKFEQEIVEILNIDRFKEINQNEDEVRWKIINSAKKYEIPLLEKNTAVTRTEDNRLKVEVKYTKIISLPIYGEYKWDFEIVEIQDI